MAGSQGTGRGSSGSIVSLACKCPKAEQPRGVPGKGWEHTAILLLQRPLYGLLSLDGLFATACALSPLLLKQEDQRDQVMDGADPYTPRKELKTTLLLIGKNGNNLESLEKKQSFQQNQSLWLLLKGHVKYRAVK